MHTIEQTHDAIKRLVVRGAPAIGIAAATAFVWRVMEREKRLAKPIYTPSNTLRPVVQPPSTFSGHLIG